MYGSGFFHRYDHTFPFFQGLAYRLRNAVTIFWIGNDAIDNHLDVVNLETIDLHLCSDLQEFAIDTDFCIALFSYLNEQLAVMTFTATNDRCEQCKFLSFKIIEDGVYDLVFRLSHHLLPCK